METIQICYTQLVSRKLAAAANARTPDSLSALACQHAAVLGLALEKETPTSLDTKLGWSTDSGWPVLTLTSELDGTVYTAHLTRSLHRIYSLHAKPLLGEGTNVGVECISDELPEFSGYNPATNSWLDAPALQPALNRRYTFRGAPTTVREQLVDIALHPERLADDDKLQGWLTPKGISLYRHESWEPPTLPFVVRLFPSDSSAGGNLEKVLGPAASDALLAYAGRYCRTSLGGHPVCEFRLHHTKSR